MKSKNILFLLLVVLGFSCANNSGEKGEKANEEEFSLEKLIDPQNFAEGIQKLITGGAISENEGKDLRMTSKLLSDNGGSVSGDITYQDLLKLSQKLQSDPSMRRSFEEMHSRSFSDIDKRFSSSSTSKSHYRHSSRTIKIVNGDTVVNESSHIESDNLDEFNQMMGNADHNFKKMMPKMQNMMKEISPKMMEMQMEMMKTMAPKLREMMDEMAPEMEKMMEKQMEMMKDMEM